MVVNFETLNSFLLLINPDTKGKRLLSLLKLNFYNFFLAIFNYIF